MKTLLKNGIFIRLLSSTSVSQLGSFFTYMLLIVVSYGKTHSLGTTMGVMVAASIGTALSGIFSGVLVDRRSPVMLMILSNLCCAVPIAALFWLPATYPVYYAVSFIVAIFTTVNQPAFTKYQVQIIADDDLPAANAALQMIQEIIKVVGPALAVFVLAFLAPDMKRVGFLVDAASYVIASGIILSLRKPTPAPASVDAGDEANSLEQAEMPKKGFFRSWLEGFSTFRNPLVVTVLILFAFILLGIAGTDVTFTSYISNSGYSTLYLGYVISALSLGLILMSLFAQTFVEKLPLSLSLGATAACVGIFYALIASSKNIVIMLICAFCIGVFNAIFNVAALTYWQRAVPMESMGRFFGLVTSLFSIIGILGMLVNGSVGSFFGARITILSCGSVIALASLVSMPIIMVSGRQKVAESQSAQV